MASQPRPFPRYLELPNAKNYAPEWGLRQSKATLRDITDPQYWRKLCPELTVSDDKKSEERINYDKDLVRDVREQVDTEGVTIVHADQIPWQGLDFSVLARSVVRLLQFGWPASFILMYDEAWDLVNQLNALMVDATGNSVNMDILAWYIDPNEGHVGFSPHRDRQPPNAPASFRPDGGAMYTTAWVPFTDACPDNSCLYVLPRWADPGYFEGDRDDGPDPLPLALNTKESYQHIRALPAEAGAAVIFTHRIIHWGSKGRKGFHTPRINLSFGCADDQYEPPYFDRKKHLPSPSVAMRAALVCAQMIVYHERFDLTPKQLATFRRMFEQQSSEFHPTYRAKVLQEYVAASTDVTARHKPPATAPTTAPASGSGRPPLASSAAADNDTQRGRRWSAGSNPPQPQQPQSHQDKDRGKSRKDDSSLQKTASANGGVPEAKDDSKKSRKRSKPESTRDSGGGRDSGAGDRDTYSGGGAGGRDSHTHSGDGHTHSGGEEEEEGPGIDIVLQQSKGANVDSDVDLLDDALDAVLDAKLGGYDNVQDDFGSDMEGGAPSQGRGAIHRDGDTDMPPVTGNGDREEADIVKGILSDEGTGGSHSDTGSDSRSREGSEVDSELDRVINSLETAHKSDQHAREGREGGRGGHGSDTSYEDPRKDDPRRRGGSPERGGGGGGGGGVGGGGGGGVGFGGITGVDLRGLSRRQRREIERMLARSQKAGGQGLPGGPQIMSRTKRRREERARAKLRKLREAQGLHPLGANFHPGHASNPAHASRPPRGAPISHYTVGPPGQSAPPLPPPQQQHNAGSDRDRDRPRIRSKVQTAEGGLPPQAPLTLPPILDLRSMEPARGLSPARVDRGSDYRGGGGSDYSPARLETRTSFKGVGGATSQLHDAVGGGGAEPRGLPPHLRGGGGGGGGGYDAYARPPSPPPSRIGPPGFVPHPSHQDPDALRTRSPPRARNSPQRGRGMSPPRGRASPLRGHRGMSPPPRNGPSGDLPGFNIHPSHYSGYQGGGDVGRQRSPPRGGAFEHLPPHLHARLGGGGGGGGGSGPDRGYSDSDRGYPEYEGDRGMRGANGDVQGVRRRDGKRPKTGWS